MSSVLDRPAPDPDLVLSYADRPDAVVDVYLPPGETDRLVTYLHGGFWRQAYDRTHARPLAAALARDGAVVALPEFRRVGGGGGWPTTCHDVRAAVAALPALLATEGITIGETALTGHSAGGHLTLWLAATGTVADRFVAIAPVGDLRHAAATGMGDGAVADFLGTTTPLDAADPGVLLGAGRPAGPVSILHGTADDVVSIDNTRGLVDRFPWIELVELAGADHYDPIDPVSPAYPVLRAALLEDPTAG